MHKTHDNEWGMGEVAKRLGSHLFMHEAEEKQHQQGDIKKVNLHFIFYCLDVFIILKENAKQM